ncbi:MAG: metallophosphoesterase [Paludibacteraceae bacterium]|nr:metallophosphoesterase [Paludibacteraceae bacterium]
MKKTIFLLTAVLFVACAKTPECRQLTILHTNDTHSQILPEDEKNIGGYARRIGVINQEREADPNLLLLDAGDFSQGTPYFNFFHGRIEVAAMNWMKYDAATLGNHEFDNGLDTLAAILREAQFPIICANYDCTGTPLEDIVKPYIILERNDIKIGIFGMGCYPYSVIDDDNFRPIKYLEPYAVAQRMADTLRAQGCEVVICLSHQGTNPHDGDEPCDKEMVAKTRGIDLVIGGHTHELVTDLSVQNLDGKEVPLRQMKKYGSYLGKVMLCLGDKNEK